MFKIMQLDPTQELKVDPTMLQLKVEYEISRAKVNTTLKNKRNKLHSLSAEHLDKFLDKEVEDQFDDLYEDINALQSYMSNANYVVDLIGNYRFGEQVDSWIDLADLTETQKIVFQLRFNKIRFIEISEYLGVSIKAVDAEYRRARRKVIRAIKIYLEGLKKGIPDEELPLYCRLSQQEREIYSLLLKGLTYSQIAKAVHLKEVKKQIQRINKKKCLIKAGDKTVGKTGGGEARPKIGDGGHILCGTQFKSGRATNDQ